MPSPETLPKSVKVRSTCNACQQAKIRCSHEKPSCRRCQKNKIECIYSVSRRLGRPAKRKEATAEDKQPTQQQQQHQGKQQEVGKGTPPRRKGRGFASPASEGEGRRDERAMNGALIGDLNTPVVNTDPLDLTDSWLPDLSPLDVEPSSRFEAAIAAISTGLKDPVPFPGFPATPEMLNEHTRSFSLEGTTAAAAAPATALPSVMMDWDLGSTSYSLDMLTPVGDPHSFLVDDLHETSNEILTEMWLQHATTSFANTHATDSTSSTTTATCHCYETSVRELLRINNTCTPANGPCTIDAILTCQKALQQLGQKVLRCACARVRANLLMIIIVEIDSLVTAIETQTLSSASALSSSPPSSSSPSPSSFPFLHSGGGREFKHSIVDSCPLSIGGFRVSTEEKIYFVRQILHARLAGLLTTVRRIRACAQQVWTGSSRGRLLMILETDRRLQLLMVRLE
ncbi:hypothetical protein ASPZODRAFT_16635 [Penicilliopsis zonata CBS 506.65]|uniref:Zn(2)-C6 fungal-type domain-containing protein n=1 Tax=Penicilliopsis zonata CBS 506.65 TaxID=1073090 RepID=A0A1L9SFS9_9EURO|nr:hypothetical protein ASPZODRAFT_16635 [Penicilliopsis zonata CBS 506.65]OJJ46039.1 hypothetical protein ASPZODRAFT_16635 [Penicilliopsis zonata CBS 506.65]